MSDSKPRYKYVPPETEGRYWAKHRQGSQPQVVNVFPPGELGRFASRDGETLPLDYFRTWIWDHRRIQGPVTETKLAIRILEDALDYHEHDNGIPKKEVHRALEALGVPFEKQPGGYPGGKP